MHNGHPPCSRCQRQNQRSCELTDSRESPLRPRRDSLRVRHRTRSTPRASSVAGPTIATDSRNGVENTPPNPVASLSSSTLINACDTYRKKFPIANFLHYPSLITNISTNPSSVDPVFVASLLSLCACFLPGHGLESGEAYAEYAREELARKAFEAPSLSLAQSLVMITFYEWGSGRPYKAWMYSGTCIICFHMQWMLTGINRNGNLHDPIAAEDSR